MLFALLQSLALAWGFSAPNPATPVEIPAKYLFVPANYDDTDEVVVYVDGVLENTCWRVVPETSKPAPNGKQFEVAAHARYEKQRGCRDVDIAYTVPIVLGELEPDRYEISTNAGTLNRTLTVHPTRVKNGMKDDQLYAPVEEIRFAYHEGKPAVRIEGTFSNTCLRLGEVAVLPPSEGTIDVLPVLNVDLFNEGDGTQCQAIDVPFSAYRPLPQLSEGRYLLHARSLNGVAKVHAFTSR